MNEVQPNKMHLIESQIAECMDLSKKVSLYLEYIEGMLYTDPKRSLELCDNAMEYTETGDDAYFCILYSKTKALSILGRYDKAMDLVNIGLPYFSSNNDRHMTAKLLLEIAHIYIKTALHSHAQEILQLVNTEFLSKETIELNFLHTIHTVERNHYGPLSDVIDMEPIESLQNHYKQVGNGTTIASLKLFIAKARTYCHQHQYEFARVIYLQTIKISEEIAAEVLLIEVYYELGMVYKNLKTESEMVACYVKSIELAEKYQVNNHNINAMFELYQYFSKIKSFEKSLEYLEKHTAWQAKNEAEKSNLLKNTTNWAHWSISKSEQPKQTNTPILNITTHLLLKDLKNNFQKIDIKDIVFVKKDMDILKIQLVGGRSIFSNISFKEFSTKLETENEAKELFFETNSRNQMVNLYWMERLDLEKKSIILRALHQEFQIPVSKRQFVLLKKHLKSNNNL